MSRVFCSSTIDFVPCTHDTQPCAGSGGRAGASILGEMMHVASLKFLDGREKSLEILYNVGLMQRPVGHDQRAYSTGMMP